VVIEDFDLPPKSFRLLISISSRLSVNKDWKGPYLKNPTKLNL
jgi:hypothetical protein